MNFDKEWTKELVPLNPKEFFLQDESAPGVEYQNTTPISPSDNDDEQDGNQDVIRLQTKEFISNVELMEPQSVKA